jgi:serine O-acetyltransferase
MLKLAKAYQSYDPVKPSILEVILCYPGYRAIKIHRISNKLYKLNFKILARLISEFSRLITAIEIHPGAQIGDNLIIDHGYGVVIGETAIIKNNVIIYQGVTLGASKLIHGRRHPTIGNNVVIGCYSQVLGNIHIEDNTTIKANSLITFSTLYADQFVIKHLKANHD